MDYFTICEPQLNGVVYDERSIQGQLQIFNSDHKHGSSVHVGLHIGSIKYFAHAIQSSVI